MAGSIIWLEPAREVVQPARFGSDHPMRTVTEQIGAGDGWSPERASFVAGVFDELSVDWHADHSSDLRLAPLEDALDRGDVGRGRLVEIGCGTGAATERIATRSPVAAALDLSPRMLALADASVAPFVQADASSLPLATGSVDVVVLVNMFMFAAEYDRVLAPGGRFVWISTMGDGQHRRAGRLGRYHGLWSGPAAVLPYRLCHPSPDGELPGPLFGHHRIAGIGEVHCHRRRQ